MFKRIYSHFTNNETAPLHWVDQMLFWIGAVLVSVAAILFAKISAIGNNFFLSVITDYPALGVIACPIGFGLIVWLTRRFFVGAEGSGIPQVIAAIDAPEIANRASVLSLRVAIGKVLLTTIGLCFGASVGREGPTVQIGAAIMHKMGKLRSLPPYQIRRALILAGGAAGIAAAFNTPLAGILFAIEELSRSFEEKTSGTVLTTVIVSGFVSMAVLGNYTYFGSTDVVLGLVEAWKPVLICGVLGGVLGGLFSKLLILFSQTLPGRIGQMIGEHPVWFAGFCGLGVGLLGFCSVSSIYGTGYQEAKSLLEGDSHL
ncbi:MAG: chloride channel protein, partial [Bdellovibrionales bacterium]